ncbi:hypothetical protein NCCP2495_02170 [Dietzia sp. NCCP-2495]|uniref:hypothetical protein n=1 Tax=Dietzia sp. NCCP-2495 TaxID=2934675 RepID=UPI00223228CD|nr:hypothetical protein [Dietzia sp. NCCP-2495]GLB62339.1 hypothetical protein NCCP2495_02170 [Dietzia sp. NCCP-2495]
MHSPVVLVPGAPVMVPELSGTAAAVSAGPLEVVHGLIRDAHRDVTRVVVVGTDPAGRRLTGRSSTLGRWGADVRVGRAGDPAATDAEVPDTCVIAWWLLDRAGSEVPRTFIGVAGGPGEAGTPGWASMLGEGDLVVVAADGPASLNLRAPVPEDPRGVALDSGLAAWLRDGGALPDPGADTAEEIGWWSRPAWRLLDDLVGGAAAREAISWAPFGVGYHAARWDRHELTPGTRA